MTSAKNALIGVLLSVVPVAGLSAQMRIDETDDLAAAQLNIVREFVSSLQQRENSCDDPMLEQINVGITNLESRMLDLEQMAFSPRSGVGTRHAAQRELRLAAPVIIEARTSLASGLLKSQCLEAADDMYRAMLRTYSGDLYDSVREEAAIGIDDVRAAKTAQPSGAPELTKKDTG